MWHPSIRMVITAGLFFTLVGASAQADLTTFNSDVPANNAATRADWLAAIGIASPQYVVDFETGFTNGQNISGIPGLFPAGLVIADTSDADAAIIRSGAGVINGSDPVGVFSVTQNESPYLKLDFSAGPVDYVAFQDIDQAGTIGVVRFVGGGTANISLDTTAAGGDTAEFFGIFRNDLPGITSVELDAAGDSLWGLDTIEYGVVAGPGPGPVPVPVPGALLLGAIGLGVAGGWSRRYRTR